MASLIRVGFARIINGTKNVSPVVQIRNISGKTMRVEQAPKKPAPWNYKEKPFTILNFFSDKTMSRLDENSKIIVVEGPIAAGKTKFAKDLADELEMAYFPEANMDMIYINDYGYDLKQLDAQLPESQRSFDVNNFLLNPKHKLSATFQIKQYILKYSQYIDALAHVLSTGQGVVLDRCVYSDFVFLEAMYSQRYVSKGARSAYYEVRQNSIGELLKPHLVIYLDVPTDKVLQNVKQRNISYEVKSNVLNIPYLSVMENHYKQKYLKDISQNSELLVYDWSNDGDAEVVVEDIERINFDKTTKDDPKFSDWKEHNEEAWALLRYKYATNKNFLMTYMNVPRFDVPELVFEAEDCKAGRDIIDNAPGMQYVKGYNKNMGDSNSLFKTSVPFRETLPLRERRIQ